MNGKPASDTAQGITGLVLLVMVGTIGFGIWRATSPADADVSGQLGTHQAAFQQAIIDARTAYNDAPNDLVRDKERPKRGEAVCAAVPSPEVRDWVGTVYDLTSTGDGSGVFSVELEQDIWLSTWNNSASETTTGLHTLVPADSPLYGQIAGLRKGQQVMFSGSFFMDKADGDCFNELSLTMRGSMSEPAFLFRFSDVRPAP